MAGDLIGVSALSANDVWFVGGAASTGQAFIYHWNGTSITQSTSVNPGTFNRLYDVVALAANDVWAVGEYRQRRREQDLNRALGWNELECGFSPTSSNEYTKLLGDRGRRAERYLGGGRGRLEHLCAHWDGNSWSWSTPEASFSSFKDVSATPAGVVWAVGEKSGGTLTERWTGQAWEVVASPAPGGFANDLNGVVVLAANDVWAVGAYDQAGNFKTLACTGMGRNGARSRAIRRIRLSTRLTRSMPTA